MAVDPKRTNKPCPGCGEVMSQFCSRKAWRLDTEVCNACKANLDFAKRTRAGNAALDDRLVYRLGSRGWRYGAVHCKEVADLGAAWRGILQTFVPGVPVGRQYQAAQQRTIGSSGDSYAEREVLLLPQQVEALRAMGAAMDAALTAVHEKSLDHGRNLLAQLAAGEISVDDLNAGDSAERLERSRDQRRRGMLEA